MNHVTEQIKTTRFGVQRNEIHQVQYTDRSDHKMQRSLKSPQVQYINKIIQKVQQITEVSQQQHMNVDVLHIRTL